MTRRSLGERLTNPQTPAELRTAVVHRLEGWQVVAEYEGSNGARHTVERNGNEYRCTCQGFRIRKRGYCKHTDWAKQEGK